MITTTLATSLVDYQATVNGVLATAGPEIIAVLAAFTAFRWGWKKLRAATH